MACARFLEDAKDDSFSPQACGRSTFHCKVLEAAPNADSSMVIGRESGEFA